MGLDTKGQHTLGTRAQRVLKRLHVKTPADFRSLGLTLADLRDCYECGPATALEIRRWLGDTMVKQLSSERLEHLARKALEAQRSNSVAQFSSGERVACALILNRPDWLLLDDHTLASAIDRLDSDWLAMVPRVARELGTFYRSDIAEGAEPQAPSFVEVA